MTCPVDLMALERGGISGDEIERIEEHVTTCPRCAKRIAAERELSLVLHQLGDIDEIGGPPDAKLLRAFRAQRRWRRHRWLAALASAAAVVALVAIARLGRGRFREVLHPMSPEVRIVPDLFVSNIGTESATGTDVYVLSVKVPRGALPLLGIAAQIDPPLEPVATRIAIGSDGLARLVPVPPERYRSSSNAR